jgi:hypothetical protein
LEKTKHFWSETIKEINRIQGKLNRSNNLEAAAIKKFVHVSVRIKGLKSSV